MFLHTWIARMSNRVGEQPILLFSTSSFFDIAKATMFVNCDTTVEIFTNFWLTETKNQITVKIVKHLFLSSIISNLVQYAYIDKSSNFIVVLKSLSLLFCPIPYYISHISEFGSSTR